MQKYVLVTFLEPIAEGTEFTVGNWPLHTTLVSNFVVDLEGKQLAEKLAQLFAIRNRSTPSACKTLTSDHRDRYTSHSSN